MNEAELNAEIAALNDDLLRTATWLHNAEKERDEWRSRFEAEVEIRREWAIRAEAAEAERDSLRDEVTRKDDGWAATSANYNRLRTENEALRHWLEITHMGEGPRLTHMVYREGCPVCALLRAGMGEKK